MTRFFVFCSQQLGGRADPTLDDQNRASFAFSACSTGAVGVSIKLQKGGKAGFKEAWMEEDSDSPREGTAASPAWRGLDRPPAL